MKSGKRLGWLAAILGIVALLQLWAVVAPAHAADDFVFSDSVAAVFRVSYFAEPLVPTAPTTVAEDEALLQAIEVYAKGGSPDDVRSLTEFLSQYPHSGWAPALLTNLGLSYLHNGYFSRALDAWRQAWLAGKTATDPRARALVDRAVGELMRLYSSLGDVESAQALFVELGDRHVTGSATEAVQLGVETISIARRRADHLFNCGPMALKSLLLKQGASAAQVNHLLSYKAGPNGTSLAEVAKLADEFKFPYRLVFRQPGQSVPVPSIVHFKVGHFAAIVEEVNGRYRIEDSAFPGHAFSATPAALDAEASGYFLVPASPAAVDKWRSVDQSEAGAVWGKGEPVSAPGIAGALDKGAHSPDGAGTPADGTNPGGSPGGKPPQPGNNGGSTPPTCGMCGYDIHESTVSLNLSDTPLPYEAAYGPSAQVQLSYNQREDSQPGNPNFFNVSSKWTLNWLAYITDTPGSPEAGIKRYLSRGGAYYYGGSMTGKYGAQYNDGSILQLVSQSPIIYKRYLRTGMIEVYAQSDGSTSGTRNIFLSQVIDPQGNSVTLTYDSLIRLTSLTDATGRQTIFSYDLPGAGAWLVTRITDPFGRTAALTYTSDRHLSSITDALGITSSFAYDASWLVNAMTTPYGVTSFAYTVPGLNPPRFLQITDPLGYIEREEWKEWPEGGPSYPPNDGETVPCSKEQIGCYPPPWFPDQYATGGLQYRNSYYWDKNAFAAASCDPDPNVGCSDPAHMLARIRQFHRNGDSSEEKVTSLESVKYPLENRIWYEYPGQVGSAQYNGGSYGRPSATGRVLRDPISGAVYYIFNFTSYDTAHYYNITQVSDAAGRTTQFTYDPANYVDITTVTQGTTGNPAQWGFYPWTEFAWTPASPTAQTFTIARYTYNTCNAPHQPCTYTDAAGQTTTYTYNSTGQLTSLINPLNQTTTYAYDNVGNLTSITNANGATAANLTYDSYARVRTYTDSEGWVATYDYDDADRVTRITYPDGTTTLYTYDKLDLAKLQDRQGRVWTYTHDANRRLIKITDPASNQTQFAYNGIGEVTGLTDSKGNVTNWTYDIQGRLTSKIYPDSKIVTYTYDPTTSRLASVTDAMGQTKTYSYFSDDRLSGITYTGAINTTHDVSFTDDPYFPHRTQMVDGTGTTNYTYVAPGSNGALRLSTETSPLPSSTITYAYDALGRPTSRTVTGAGAETFGYDTLSRLSSHNNDLGGFSLSYLGETRQVTSRNCTSGVCPAATPPNPSLGTIWSYQPNVGDRRLASVNNNGFPGAGQYSNFTITTKPTLQDWITEIDEATDASTIATPGTGTQSATYNNLNQLTNLSGQAYTYDDNGNLTADGVRNYAWDAENRLVKITYAGISGKETDFAYDGLGRRTAITSIPAGGGTGTTTAYIWCGSRLCQARDSSYATTSREYLAEGEYLPGSPAQTYYYGIDQIGSVRRVFATTSSAPAYDYDPYGNLTSSASRLADFGYAGMFYNQDSSLSFTWFRGYNPSVGRWLSRDPIGEASDLRASLYAYAGQNPIRYTDSFGLAVGDLPPPPPGYDAGTWQQGQWPNGRYWVKDPEGNVYTAHPEDRDHWRHWDKRDNDNNDQGQCPPNSGKPQANRRRPLSDTQSADDPNGDETPWAPNQAMPRPVIPIVPVDPIPIPDIIIRIPFLVPG